MRSAGSGAMLGTSRCKGSLTVAPDTPHARHATGRPVWRARARAVTAVTVSSPRERPTPETDDSPIPTTRIGSPAPSTFPSCGGFAAGSRGTRRRVAEPWAQASGDSASDPTRPVTTVERDTSRGAEGGSQPMIEHWAYCPAETRNWSRLPQPSDHQLVTPD